MNGNKRKPYTSRFAKFEGNSEFLDLDLYDELVEEGLQDREIAKELNVNEQFLESMKKDIYKEY